MKTSPIVLPFEQYRRQVYGCWLGKSIGGTLGGPWEGHTPPKELTFYDPIPTAMLENDDLDLQLVWLARLRESGFPITGTLFARGWKENIQAWPDEYGTCRRNLDQGLMPPLSGAYDNGFTAGMGSAIRTELWACLAPGDPELARYFTREDARCDHAAEGVWAAEFLVTIESLAFVEKDRDRLIAAGLKAIPADCRVARAIKFVRDNWEKTPDRKTLFEKLDKAHGHQNFTDVAINLAIIVLGWYLGGGDFGKAILAAVNCGYDADCTCATLGAILGLIDPDGISDEWKKPIGEKIALGGYITGINPPQTLADLTRQTAVLARECQRVYGAKIVLGKTPGLEKAPPVRFPEKTSMLLKRLHVPDSASVLCEHPIHLALHYPDSVRVAPGKADKFRLVATNTGGKNTKVELRLRAPLDWKLGGSVKKTVSLAVGASATLAFTASPVDSAWRPFTSGLEIEATIGGVPMKCTAGLLVTIPMSTWNLDTMPGEEPMRPKNAHVVEGASHFLDLAPHTAPGRTLVFQLELKDFMTRSSLRRFVVQSSAKTRVWIAGQQVIEHDGTWHVSALHRARKTSADAEVSAPTRVTIAMDGKDPGILFHAIGEAKGNCNRWISRVEYRRPS
jgi:ADP-ribosylglycohydrolase